MKVYDLTKEKYKNFVNPSIFVKIELSLNNSDLLSNCAEFTHLFGANIKVMDSLAGIPVYLVESSMSGKCVSIPGTDCSIHVPKDEYSEIDINEFDIHGFVNEAERQISQTENPKSTPYSIFDLLGIYIYSGVGTNNPHQIFIWVDKIQKGVQEHITYQETERDNLLLDIFKLVLCHEFAHAIMNTELYGVYPSPKISYNNPVYRYIEEAFANAIALSVVMPFHSKEEEHTSGRKDFTENFVRQQGLGYADGWILYLLYRTSMTVCWMKMKVKFNGCLAKLLSNFWKTKDIQELCFDCETIC